ncbi:MAG: hypothetical protein U5L45_11355 [Saprospiraceae bacterium]|nr:hypothetical protein [Saprospiraceae bacterium]
MTRILFFAQKVTHGGASLPSQNLDYLGKSKVFVQNLVCLHAQTKILIPLSISRDLKVGLRFSNYN